jgi:hypothetical protein
MKTSTSLLKSDRYFQLAIALLILLPHLLIIFGQQNMVLSWFNTDDAFYYFKTAQNIVEGQGVTFDGIARSNGFHPLWMILLLPIFTLARFDLILPLRLVIALQVMLGVGSALLLYRLCRSRCSGWAAFLIGLFWAYNPVIYEVVIKGGTEAGLNAFFLVMFWWLFYRVSEQLERGKINFGRIVILGCVATLALLSRLDNVYLVFIAGGWLLLRFWRQPKADAVTLFSTLKWWLKLGLAYFTPLVTTLGLYLVVNQLYFGSAMPVSGKIKRWWGTLKFTVYGTPPKDLGDFWEEFFSPSDLVGPWSIVMNPLYRLGTWFNSQNSGLKFLWGSVLVVLVALLSLMLYRHRRYLLQTIWRWNLIALLAGCLVQIFYYKAFGHIAQKGWYWIAEMLLVVLLLGIVLEVIAREMEKLPYGRKLQAASALFLAVALLLPVAQGAYRALSSPGSSDEHFYLRRARFLEENTEPGALIGMTGSGSSGYFVQDRTIVNLDGLINSMEYFIHLQNATADEYLEAIGVRYVFGNAYILQNSNPYQWIFEDRLEEYRYFQADADKTLVLFQFH